VAVASASPIWLGLRSTALPLLAVLQAETSLHPGYVEPSIVRTHYCHRDISCDFTSVPRSSQGTLSRCAVKTCRAAKPVKPARSKKLGTEIPGSDDGETVLIDVGDQQWRSSVLKDMPSGRSAKPSIRGCVRHGVQQSISLGRSALQNPAVTRELEAEIRSARLGSACYSILDFKLPDREVKNLVRLSSPIVNGD
jgi:hypothetical protein